MSRTELERSLRKILDTLRDYLDDLVLIGGWVPYLYLTYASTSSRSAVTSLTTEADVLIPGELTRGERRPISEILEDADFRPVEPNRVIWAREPERGETIEFFRAHQGPADSVGKPTLIPDQPGLTAVTLDHLWILEAYVQRLTIPPAEDHGDTLEIRIPRLGGFVLNKANTFNLRSGPDRAHKGGKDLVYLRDIMAAGEEDSGFVEEDLNVMMASDNEKKVRVTRYIRRATVHLEKAAPNFHSSAAKILEEREGMVFAEARADVEGHLADLTDLLNGLS